MLGETNTYSSIHPNWRIYVTFSESFWFYNNFGYSVGKILSLWILISLNIITQNIHLFKIEFIIFT